MRNRARCKLCGDVLESFLKDDFVSCSCGEIYIGGGAYALVTGAKDYTNFLRVDDLDNEIPVKYQEKSEDDVSDDQKQEEKSNEAPPPSRHEMLQMLDKMIEDIERLPAHALHTPVTQADYCSLLLVLSAILRAS